MDRRICVYEAGETDFAGNGLGTVSPTKCTIYWEENGEYSLEIEHPIDELGKYQRLNACGRVIVAPVPEAPSMRLSRTSSTTTVDLYAITTRESRLRLRSGPGTNYKCLGYYAKGKQVALINKTSASWYEVTAPDGKHGWMSANYLTYVGSRTVESASAEILRDLPMRPQPFDIYATEPGLEQISARARHVVYRLAENIVCSLEIKDKTAQQALDAAFAAAENQNHGFNWYCEETETASLKDGIEGKSLMEILLGDGGICETYGLKLLADWFDVFLVKDIGQDRGVQIRYGKNLQGLEGGFDCSGVTTRIIPVGQTKGGKPLYLSGTKYLESSHAGLYSRPVYGYLRVSDAKVGSEVDGEKLTEASARERMRKAAQAELDAGCDLPDCSISAVMTQLRHDPAYAGYEELERICPGDTLSLFVPNFALALTIQCSAYAFDALAQVYDELTLGTPQVNVSNTGISSRQLGGASVTSSKIAPGAIGSSALANDIVSARHIQADSINTTALQVACVTATKIAAGVITAAHLDANTVDAKIANVVLANLTTANIQNANIDWAEVATLNAQIAEIAKMHITDADIDWAQIENLTAAVADVAEAVIADATISTAQIDNLTAVIAEAIHLEAAIGNFSLAEVKNLLSNALILQEGAADSMLITNLAVTSANMLNAVVDRLVIRGPDDSYYRIQIDSDGRIATEEVTVSEDEIATGETDDGRQIVATTANVGSLNATNVKASQAIISTIFAESLEAGQITAGEALIASATIPTLYARVYRRLVTA